MSARYAQIDVIVPRSPSFVVQRHRRAWWIRHVLLAALVGVSACGPRYVRSPALPAAAQWVPSGLSRHVVVVSIDGLRPDAIAPYAAPVLQRLIREGSHTLSASTILPSKTLPSHVSMLTGLLPERHQISWNRAVATPGDAVAAPTVFAEARSRGLRTAAFFSKAKFGLLQRPGTLDYSQAPGGWFGRWSADRTASDVETYLADARPHLLFVHLPDPDVAGHRSGWMTPAYARAVAAADTAVGRVLDASARAFGPANFTLIVTADHGGHNEDHGSSDQRDTAIPWIAWGAGVSPGLLPADTIRTVDTAPTVLWLFGVSPPSEWDGRPVTRAFAPLVRAAATDLHPEVADRPGSR